VAVAVLISGSSGAVLLVGHEYGLHSPLFPCDSKLLVLLQNPGAFAKSQQVNLLVSSALTLHIASRLGPELPGIQGAE
jgi:hypothetical protein